MSNRLSLLFASVLCAWSLTELPAATTQSLDNVLPDGSAFLWVEGEDYLEGIENPTTGFIPVDKSNPFQTVDTAVKGELDVLPADTNASAGAAIFQSLEGGGTATWEVEFAIPAIYYLYVHWSMYNRDTNTNYGNEDSFYAPPAFNADSRDAWIDFEGVNEFGDPKVGDSNRDGFIDGFATMVNVVSAGEIETHNSTDEDFWDGQFHWIWINRANDMDANGQFISFDGHGIRYEVTEADVGTVMDFQISTREPYGAIDGFLFSTNNQLLEDFTQEQMDGFFLREPAIAGLQAGDADQDLDFDQLDLVQVQVAAKYLSGESATWGEGDWNGAPGGSPGNSPAGDDRFNQLDIISALSTNTYLTGPYAAIAENGVASDQQTSVGYSPVTGEVFVDAPAGTELTSINIDSASGIFTGLAAQNLGGSFDNDADGNIFKATFGGSFGSLSFGNVAQTGLSQDALLNDLTVVGSLAGGGDLGAVDLIYVPEPASLFLLVAGVALVSAAVGLGRARGR